MRPLTYSPSFALVLAIAPAFAAEPDNLVRNAHFHRDVVLWESVRSPSATAFQYVAGIDATAAIDSGAVQVTNTSGGNFTLSGVSQCVPVEEGHFYRFGGTVRILGGQSSVGQPLMELQFSRDADCSNVDSVPVHQIGLYDGSVVGRWVEIALDDDFVVEVPTGMQAALLSLLPIKTDGTGDFSAFFDDVYLLESCAESVLGGGVWLGGGLCLSQNRFQVSVEWTTDQATGEGQPTKLTSDTGYFWFFDDANIELVVKIVDACDLPGFESFWVFAAGLTDAEVRLTVLDTVARETRTYTNELGEDFAPVLDTGAFDTCGF